MQGEQAASGIAAQQGTMWSNQSQQERDERAKEKGGYTKQYTSMYNKPSPTKPTQPVNVNKGGY
jgi:hypothetical protein